MLTEERRTEFHEAIASHKLSTDSARTDRPLLIVGVLLMVAGAAGAFVEYSASLSQSDARDIASSQILAIAFGVLTVVGAALYIGAAISRVLRVWLLRQLVESQARTEQLARAVLSAQQD
jgi:hypothetical protein